MKKLMLIVAGVFAVSVICAQAEQATESNAAPEKAKSVEKTGPKMEMQKITVTGTISKKEWKSPKGDTMSSFVLTTAEGDTVRLGGHGPGASGAETTPDLAQYVGAKVTITGMGMQRERNGKKMIAIRKIENVEKVAEAPAAPAAAPAEKK
jgi:hypothetical protein